MVRLGGEPVDVTADSAEDEDPGVTFWAEPGDQHRLLRVFSREEFLPVGGARWHVCGTVGVLSGQPAAPSIP